MNAPETDLDEIWAEIDRLEAETLLLKAKTENKQTAEIQSLIGHTRFNITRSEYYLIILGALLFAAGGAFYRTLGS